MTERFSATPDTLLERAERIAGSLMKLGYFPSYMTAEETASMLRALIKRCSADRRTFSDFIRNATPEEKEAVYSEVMAKATERQKTLASSTTESIVRNRELGFELAMREVREVLRRAELNRNEIMQNGTCAFMSPRPNGLWVNWHFIEELKEIAGVGIASATGATK